MTGRLSGNVHDSLESRLRFGQRLREARENAGLTQLQLAELSGYTNGWVSNVERGDGTPTSTFARRMEIILSSEDTTVDLGIEKVVVPNPRGAVGTWGMSAAEVAGYVGLSRTRVYELMRREDLRGNRRLASVNVEGFKRVDIAVLAVWIIDDHILRGMVSNENDRDSLIEKENEDIRQWLAARRSYVLTPEGQAELEDARDE